MDTLRLPVSELADTNCAQALKSIQSHILRSPDGLNLDMRDVHSVSRLAIKKLFELQTVAERDGKRFVLFGLSPELAVAFQEAKGQFPVNVLGQEPVATPKKRKKSKKPAVNYIFLAWAGAIITAAYSLIYLVAVYIVPIEATWESQQLSIPRKQFEADVVRLTGTVTAFNVVEEAPIVILVFRKKSRNDSSIGQLIAQTYATNGAFEIEVPQMQGELNLDVYVIATSQSIVSGKQTTEIRKLRGLDPTEPVRLSFVL